MTFRLIVAGSRSVKDYETVREAIIASKFWHIHRSNLVIVSGMAKGVDMLGVEFAKRNGLEYDPMPAAWDDLDAPGAIIRINSFGKPYNWNAGFTRNIDMGKTAHGLCAVWDGKSGGTKQMIDWFYANKQNPDVYVHTVGRKK